MRNSCLICKKNIAKEKILFRCTTKVCTVHKCLSEFPLLVSLNVGWVLVSSVALYKGHYALLEISEWDCLCFIPNNISWLILEKSSLGVVPRTLLVWFQIPYILFLFIQSQFFNHSTHLPLSITLKLTLLRP